MGFRDLSSVEDRLKSSLTNAICLAIKRSGGFRVSNPLSHLPYSMNELKSDLESKFEDWMNWENWGPYNGLYRTWQIDHILPQSSLPFEDTEHPNFTKCWSLSNLRPYETAANLRKGNRPR